MRNFLMTVLTIFAVSMQSLALVPSFTEKNNFGRTKSIKMTYQLAKQNTVDILFLIDDSGSMTAYQTLLEKSQPEIIQLLRSKFLNARVGVITTSSPILFGKNQKFIEVGLPGAESELKNNLNVGIAGQGEENILGNLSAALSSPLIDNENSNFIRSQAHLGVFILSDAEDQSTVDPQKVAAQLSTFKGAAGVTVAGFLSANPATCSSDDMTEPKRVREFLTAVKGTEFSICDGDYAKKIESQLKGMESDFSKSIDLPVKPVLSTVKVRLSGKELLAGDIYQGWTYDSKKNTILIGSDVDLTSQPNGTLEIEFEY